MQSQAHLRHTLAIFGTVLCVGNSFGVGSVNQGTSSTAPGDYATVSGGQFNDANAKNTTIGGGLGNQTDAPQSTVGGGQWNWVSGTGNNSTIGGGAVNIIRGREATIAGGRENTAQDDGATIGGGQYNIADYYGTVSGGQGNVASALGAVAGGYQCEAGPYSVVGGGQDNACLGFSSVIACGQNNTLYGDYSAIGGGYGNLVNSNFSAVIGGNACEASGLASTAGGTSARANQSGSFVWSDYSIEPFVAAAANTFNVRCRGGARFVTAIVGGGGATAGVSLAAGGGSWSNISDSNMKTNVTAIDTRAILAALVSIPVQKWNYKSQDKSVRHIGPMAQDFKKAFGVGEDDKHISTVDADGVALAAIQGLHAELMLTSQDARKQLSERDAKIEQLEQRLAKIESLLQQNR